MGHAQLVTSNTPPHTYTSPRAPTGPGFIAAQIKLNTHMPRIDQIKHTTCKSCHTPHAHIAAHITHEVESSHKACRNRHTYPAHIVTHIATHVMQIAQRHTQHTYRHKRHAHTAMHKRGDEPQRR